MPKFEVAPAEETDLPSIAKVSRAAFRNSPHTMSYWMFPQDNEEGIYQWRLRGIINRFHNDSSTLLMKCVDHATGEIVSYALWQRPRPKGSEEQNSSKQTTKREENAADEMLPDGTKVELMREFDAATQEMRSKYVDPKADYILRAIATLPEYQGKGYASALLELGLEDVDSGSARVFLEATPQGLPLYQKYGWKVVDEMVFDLVPYGCNGVQVITCMMRERRT